MSLNYIEQSAKKLKYLLILIPLDIKDSFKIIRQKKYITNLGRSISRGGLLAINLDKKGDYLVKFTYVPISFYTGLVVSLITLIFMIYYFRKRCPAVRY